MSLLHLPLTWRLIAQRPLQTLRRPHVALRHEEQILVVGALFTRPSASATRVYQKSSQHAPVRPEAGGRRSKGEER